MLALQDNSRTLDQFLLDWLTRMLDLSAFLEESTCEGKYMSAKTHNKYIYFDI